MALSNFIPSSRVAQPGVIANSAARPASPYNGQVVYQTDTGQTLVWNGSAWVMLTNSTTPPGLELITSTTATSGTVKDVSNCFSATYDSYRIVVSNLRLSTGGDSIFFQMLSSGTPATTNYYVSVIRFDIGANAVATVRANGDSFVQVCYASNSAGTSSSMTLDVHNPFSAVTTSIIGQGTDSRAANGYSAWQFGGVHNSATSYDGFRIYPSTGTIAFSTANICVYGYRNSI